MIQLLLRPTKTMDLGRRSEKSSENSEDLNSVDFQLEWATAEKGGIVGVGTSNLSTLLSDLETVSYTHLTLPTTPYV